MSSREKRPILVHAQMPPELKRSLDIYSAVMQRYKTLLKAVVPEHHPPPLLALGKRDDITELDKRTEVLLSRCWRIERLIANMEADQTNKNPVYIPHHLRQFVEWPVGNQPDEERTTELSADGYPSIRPRDNKIQQVRSLWTLCHTMFLTSVQPEGKKSSPSQSDHCNTAQEAPRPENKMHLPPTHVHGKDALVRTRDCSS
jgi:hypothetical protein